MEILLRLIVPSARPVIAAFAVFSVTAHWNDLYWPMIVITSLDKATPPLGMLFFKDGDFGTDYGALDGGGRRHRGAHPHRVLRRSAAVHPGTDHDRPAMKPNDIGE